MSHYDQYWEVGAKVKLKNDIDGHPKGAVCVVQVFCASNPPLYGVKFADGSLIGVKFDEIEEVMGNNIPNLDAMSADQLWEFWREHQRGHRTKAANIFPARPKNYTLMTVQLACYACNKAVAIKLRAEKSEEAAQFYEKICEDIYNQLPEHARWTRVAT